MVKSAFKTFRNPIQIIPRFLQSKNLSTQFEKIPKEAADCVVIGAGIVGIAIARALALEGRDVLVIESASIIGTGTSSRNSEVIHAGIYYPPKSLKAVLCVRGRELLYEYFSNCGVPHEQIGKLIVATRSMEIPKLRNLLERGTENGVQGLMRMMDGFDAMQMEPELQCVIALLPPCSGIVDSHSLMLSLIFSEEDRRARLGFGAVRFISTNDNTTWMGHAELVRNFNVQDPCSSVTWLIWTRPTACDVRTLIETAPQCDLAKLECISRDLSDLDPVPVSFEYRGPELSGLGLLLS